MNKFRLFGYNASAQENLPLLVDSSGNLVISEMSSKLDTLITALGQMAITLSVLPAGSITNDMLASTAVTESKVVAKTLTHASLADAAAILGTQLATSAAIAGTQLASKTVTYDRIADATVTTSQISATAAILGSQLAANAAIAGSQLASAAGITGGQLATGVKGNIIGPYPITYGSLTGTKDVITAIPLGFIGSIVKVYGIVVTAAGGSSGAGTLDFILSASGQVQSTGPASVTLTIASTNTLDQVISQSAAPTLQNTFVAADTLKIHYTQGTTFANDTGVVWAYFVTN